MKKTTATEIVDKMWDVVGIMAMVFAMVVLAGIACRITGTIFIDELLVMGFVAILTVVSAIATLTVDFVIHKKMESN